MKISLNNMKKHLLKKTVFLLAAVLMAISVSAEEYTYDFSNSIPTGWTSKVSPNGFETTGYQRGCQFLASTTLTLSGVKNVTKVVITCSANTDKNGLAVSVAGTQWGSETLPKENNMTKTFSGAAASGNLVIDITRVEKSVYISKIVVTADESTTGGGDGDNESTLDENYSYAEPTIVTVSGATGSNAAYSFVQNNIEVKCSAGAQNETYFGCNAGNDITFTATKPIKAIVIDGYVKKEFEATVSAGNIGYVDASESEVTANPVLAVTDINSKTVTLSCVKQLRCYKVYFYFESNPDVEFETGGGDDDDYGDLTFDYEPTTATNLIITFDEVYEEELSSQVGYNLVDLYFVSDDYEMEVYVFAPKDAQCGVAPGVYPINDTYEEGTVQASPGGDDMYDYPTYLATDFEYDPDWDAYYYNTSYYLVSGTLKVEKSGNGVKYTLDAKSHYGSTIKASYVGSIQSVDEEDSIEFVEQQKTTPTKLLKDGQIIIQRNGKAYTVSGTRVK